MCSIIHTEMVWFFRHERWKWDWCCCWGYVFIVDSLQGSWKSPISYYLMKSLLPETQKVVLSHALEELHALAIRVVCVTMDGHAPTVKVCNQLGFELKGNPQEPLKTSFPTSSDGWERIFLWWRTPAQFRVRAEVQSGPVGCGLISAKSEPQDNNSL